MKKFTEKFSYHSKELELLSKVIRKPRENEEADNGLTASEISQTLYEHKIIRNPNGSVIKRIEFALRKAGYPSIKVGKKVVFGFNYIKKDTSTYQSSIVSTKKTEDETR